MTRGKTGRNVKSATLAQSVVVRGEPEQDGVGPRFAGDLVGSMFLLPGDMRISHLGSIPGVLPRSQFLTMLFPNDLGNPDRFRACPGDVAGPHDARRLGMSRRHERTGSERDDEQRTGENASNRHAMSPVQDPLDPPNLIG